LQGRGEAVNINPMHIGPVVTFVVDLGSIPRTLFVFPLSLSLQLGKYDDEPAFIDPRFRDT
jgi:hypothetical protein